MKKLLLTVMGCFALLEGCNDPNVGKDHYRFEQAQFYHPRLQINVVEVNSVQEMQKLGAQVGIDHVDGMQTAAFSVISSANNKCTIYMYNPRNKYQPEFIGHELAHCIYGQFHPNQL